MADFTITMFHNPDCGTSRNVLALIRHAGIEPEVIEYLRTPPTNGVLRDAIARMGMGVRDAVRERGTPFLDLGLDDPALTDDDLLDAMTAHPILINRPIVVTPDRVKLCRPSDTVLDLLPSVPPGNFDKDDGTPFLADQPIEPGPELADALMATHLLADDLQGPDRAFFRFRLLGGDTVGYGGFERYGADVLLRSIAVEPAERGKGIGRAMALLLMSRAFDQGGRQAYALTTTAGPFFERIGFKVLDRTKAPASILATRQAAGLCPSSAALLARRISF
jgi:arsenate reductase